MPMLFNQGQGIQDKATSASSSKCYNLQLHGDVSICKNIFPRYRKKLRFAVLNFRKPETRRFPFLVYGFVWDIVEESGPLNFGVLNMTSPETEESPYYV